MSKKEYVFKIGDSVKVKPNVKDPDVDSDIGGWVGRLTEIDDEFVSLQWDSVTLENMPATTIGHAEEKGLDWSSMGLEISEVELTQPRDSIADVKRILSRLQSYHYWDSLGEQGKRIQNVLQKTDVNDEWAKFEVWQEYLQSKLKFPFEAEIYDGDGHEAFRLGDKIKVMEFSDIDETYGILATVSFKQTVYQIPLCDLEVVKHSLPNYNLVKDYAVWFANR